MRLSIIPFEELCAPLKSLYSTTGRAGYPEDTMFKAVLLQWMEDPSDRDAARFLEENLAGKLFCGFGLSDSTPDFSTFSVFRDRLGAQRLAGMFNRVRESLKDAGLVREVFTFVDATQLISKVNLWKERDRLIAEGVEKLGNTTVAQVAADPEARFGRKGRTKLCVGFASEYAAAGAAGRHSTLVSAYFATRVRFAQDCACAAKRALRTQYLSCSE